MRPASKPSIQSAFDPTVSALISQACEHIIAAWRRVGLAPAEAAHQAEQFARHFNAPAPR